MYTRRSTHGGGYRSARRPPPRDLVGDTHAERGNHIGSAPTCPVIAVHLTAAGDPLPDVLRSPPTTVVELDSSGSEVGVKRLLIALVVLAGVLLAADYGAAALAESAVSRQMRTELSLADDPDVRINGFPFLTQAISGHYSSVDVNAAHIAVGPLRDVEVIAQLRDVDAPLSMLLGSGPKTLTVGDADGTVRVDADDLERLMPGVSKLRIENVDNATLQDRVDEGGPSSLLGIDLDSAARVVGTVSVPGIGSKEVAVISSFLLDGKDIRIVPRDVRIDDGHGKPLPLPAAVVPALQKLFTLSITPGTLPFEVTPQLLRARDGTVEISGTITNMTIGGGSPEAR